MTLSFKSVMSGLSTGILVVCAVVVTGSVVRREIHPSPRRATATQSGTPQADWLTYAADGRRVGPAKAPVAIVEFADFECPACRVLAQRIAETRRRVPNGFTVVYRHLPLDIHPFARAAAEASECAGAQGRFDQMHETLFREQAAFGSTPWRAIAASAGVADLAAFDQCMRSSAGSEAIRRDMAVADSLRMTGTPTLMINGIRFAGAIPQTMLDSLVSEGLRHR